MALPTRAVFLSAHPDDWQIFSGPAAYGHLRDPRATVRVVNLTAGDAGDDGRYWKSRHSGAVTALLRGLPSWNPYDLDEGSSGVPSSFGVAHSSRQYAGRALLHTSVLCDGREKASIVSFHLPDGRLDGAGFAPHHASMRGLREGRCALRALWPAHDAPAYASWDDLLATLQAVVAETRDGVPGEVVLYAPDAASGTEEHADHLHAGLLLQDLQARDPGLRAIWVSTYQNRDKPENLDAREGALQRAAIVAYGCGYAATVAGSSEGWRRGWEREIEAFKNRQYLRDEAG